MALVNPQIAMSYRPTTEYQPRNALAEYAQIQSIVGGQRQAEAAEMQLESLRRERDALGQIQAAIVAKGGPPDLEAAADAMIKSGKPEYLTQGMAIRTALRNQREAEAYRREFGGGATPANAMVAPAAAAAAAAAAPAPEGQLVAAPIRPIPSPITAPAAADAPAPVGETNLAYLQRQFGTPGAPAPAPTPANALAPAAAAAAPVNAMAAPDAMMAQRQALEARLRRIGNNPELKAEREMLLKQYESLLAGAAPPADVRTMQLLGFPATTEGYRQYRAAQMAPPQPRAPVAVLQNGRPVYVSPEQAVGQTPFTPASVQVLGMGPQREPAAAASQKAPAGYRFTPSGDLEPIPGGPAAPELSPKEIQKREAALPQARQAVSTVRNTMSVIKETVDRLLANETGLDGVTGAIGGRTPGITDAARQAEADLEQLQNLAFIQGITELRNASKTGAGVGNVSNKEGDRFENLKASLKRTQSLSSMKSALKRLRDQADFTDTTLQEAFDETYQYRTQREGAGGAGGAGANTVTLPDGRVMTFPNAKAAADFKKAARLP